MNEKMNVCVKTSGAEWMDGEDRESRGLLLEARDKESWTDDGDDDREYELTWRCDLYACMMIETTKKSFS